MSEIFKIILLIQFAFVLSVDSIYYAYTYDDGIGDDEHCCLVRLHDDFRLATPLTSRLIQLNDEGQQLTTNKKYMNQIIRRVNIEATHRIGKKVLLQLDKSLSEEILRNDLLCLSAATNNIHLGKCYVEFVNREEKQQQKRKGESVENETVANETIEEPPVIAADKIRQVGLTEPIVIRQGHGLAIVKRYELNSSNIRTNDTEQRRCWSWYREQTRKICQNPQKYPQVCIELNDQREKCVERLVSEESIDQDSPSSDASIHFGKKTKLFCENTSQRMKLLGYYRRSELCFQTHHQLSIEHKFTDLVHLSDRQQNHDVLTFIANHTELSQDFQHDCHDAQTFVDIRRSAEQNQPSHKEL